MITVIFEVYVHPELRQAYLDIAGRLRPLLDEIDGFLSIERFESISEPGKILALSFWRDEQAVESWRQIEMHRDAQRVGRSSIFKNYRLRVAEVTRDYGMKNRSEAPIDSRSVHGTHEQSTEKATMNEREHP